MNGIDCNGCDPDLVFHLMGCPLEGELRGRLWLREPKTVSTPEALMVLAHGRYFRVPPEARYIRLGVDNWPEYEGPGIPWTRCEDVTT